MFKTLAPMATMFKNFYGLFAKAVFNFGLEVLSTGNAVIAGSAGNTINSTGISALLKPGEFIVFETGAHVGRIFQALTVSTNSFTVNYTFASGDAPAAAVTFAIKRLAVPTYSGGAITISPIQIDKNGSDTEIKLDTSTFANNTRMPTHQILQVVDSLDSGAGVSEGVLNTATTNIVETGTGTAIVASLAAFCSKLHIFEDIGEYMALYVGGVFYCNLPLGGGQVDVFLPAGSALRLKSATGAAINSGKIAINFLG